MVGKRSGDLVTKNSQLYVFINDFLVAKLVKHSNGSLSFRYEKTWLNTEGARPVSLSLPLVDKEYSGDVVYNFFDNLLPDNPRVRAQVQAKFQAKTSHPFDLLAMIGKDCVGAIRLTDNKLDANLSKQINYEFLKDKDIANILRNHKDAPLGMLDKDDDFRISIAGVGEKTAFLNYKGRWCRPLRQTPTTHIFKLPIGFIPQKDIDLTDSCENEWLCSLIAKAYGLEVANCNIEIFDGIKVLVVDRFDRKFSEDNSWLMRLPQEDLCQSLGYSPNLKYEADGGPGIKDIMTTLHGANNSDLNKEMFFRSQVLFFMLAAIDGHAKNFSLFLKPYGGYEMTPLYDIISAYPLIDKKQLQKQKIKMAMALHGKNKHYSWSNISRRHFISTAKAVNFSCEIADNIIQDMLDKTDEVISEVKAKLPADFPKNISDSIFNGILNARKILTK